MIEKWKLSKKIWFSYVSGIVTGAVLVASFFAYLDGNFNIVGIIGAILCFSTVAKLSKSEK